jgi:hypothetical protein
VAGKTAVKAQPVRPTHRRHPHRQPDFRVQSPLRSRIRGYVTNLPNPRRVRDRLLSPPLPDRKVLPDGQERLAARPICHRTRDSIEVHPTIVAALAVFPGSRTPPERRSRSSPRPFAATASSRSRSARLPSPRPTRYPTRHKRPATRTHRGAGAHELGATWGTAQFVPVTANEPIAFGNGWLLTPSFASPPSSEGNESHRCCRRDHRSPVTARHCMRARRRETALPQ